MELKEYLMLPLLEIGFVPGPSKGCRLGSLYSTSQAPELDHNMFSCSFYGDCRLDECDDVKVDGYHNRDDVVGDGDDYCDDAVGDGDDYCDDYCDYGDDHCDDGDDYCGNVVGEGDDYCDDVVCDGDHSSRPLYG